MNTHAAVQPKRTPTSTLRPTHGLLLQRKCACGSRSVTSGECEAFARNKGSLQRNTANDNAVGEAPPIVHEVLRSPGQPLDAATRAFMQPRFGHDFSKVRVHTDARAAESARAVSARAYTVARDVVFGASEYQPDTRRGRELLAHELAHVAQQGSNTETSDRQALDLSSPEDVREVEAAKIARSIVAQPVATLPAVQRNVNSGASVQRDILEAAGTALRQGLTLDPRDLNPIGTIFNGVVTTNIAMASSISLPWGWFSTLMSYAASNLLDGAVLLGALARFPTFYRGGWILSTQPNAGAMTLDHSIFVKGPLRLSTVAHELVHVLQYKLLGTTAFLISYFGTSAGTIAYRWATGQPLNPMRSSPHEDQAYNLEARFRAWHISTYGTDPDTITV